MEKLTDPVMGALLRVWLEVSAPRVRDERGDVPGWVLITVMNVRRITVAGRRTLAA